MSRKCSDRKKQQAAKRRDSARRALDAIGLCDQLQRNGMRDHLLQCRYPQPEISLAPHQPRSKETVKLLHELKTRLKHAKCRFPLIGDWHVVDYFSFVKPILDTIHAITTTDVELCECLEAAREHTRDLQSIDSAAFGIAQLFTDLEDELIKYGRIDSHLYFLRFRTGRESDDKFRVQFELHRHIAERRMIATATGKRPAFMCGQPYGIDGIHWVKWPPDLLGLDKCGPHLDVYVQSHALDNLYRKEARALFVKDGEYLVHDYLWQSLKDPVLTPMSRSPGKFLAEYRLLGHKIGYLVIDIVDGVALVQTFLFLTMDGTPEGDALWKQLKLRRPEKEYLALDKIQTFLFTDLQDDSSIVRILKGCGCGHLFSILKDPLPNRARGYADDMRRHLRLDV